MVIVNRPDEVRNFRGEDMEESAVNPENGSSEISVPSADWIGLVNRALERKELDRLRTSVARQRPYGDEKWTIATATRLGLQSTLRDPWRPKKAGKPASDK